MPEDIRRQPQIIDHPRTLRRGFEINKGDTGRLAPPPAVAPIGAAPPGVTPSVKGSIGLRFDRGREKTSSRTLAAEIDLARLDRKKGEHILPQINYKTEKYF